MSTAILKFDLSDPDDKYHFNRVCKADDVVLTLWKIKEGIRDQYKHEADGKKVKIYKEVHEFVLGLIEELSIDLDDLLP